MDRHCDNVKEFIKKTFVFVLAFVLFSEITPIKNVLINILKFAENNNLLFDLKVSTIGHTYLLIKKYSLIYLILCIISFPLVNLYLLIRNYFNKPANLEMNPLDESLYKYINDSFKAKAYLVTGEWGSGKTYIITEFFNKYFSFSNKPIYRISCFGLESRKLILDEIKNQIEINDKSFLNWIQYIPAIGKPIYGILKDSYSLKSIPKGSIFIFDDFERITSLGITKTQRNKTYEKDKFLLRGSYSREPQYQEFKDINNEFTKIENAFSKYDRENEVISTTNNLQKYNIATGLINELIENYNLKVIIICNVDILGHDYLDKVFRGKLDCITYNKSIDEKSIESIFKNTIRNQIYTSRDIKRLVERVADKIILDFEKVWYSSGNRNLRQAKSVFQAFLDTVNILSTKVTLNDNYLLSLFYSIYVVRVLRDENGLKSLDHFLVGGNLVFFLKLYRKTDLYSSLTLSDNFKSLKWTGISIAGFWMLNFSKPSNLNELLKYFSDYEYNELELSLLESDSYKYNNEKLLIEHIVHLAREVHSKSDERNNSQVEIRHILKNNIGFIIGTNQLDKRMMEEKVRNLLSKIETLLGGMYNSNFLEELFRSIFSYSQVGAVVEDRNFYLLKQYNEFVQNMNNLDN